MHRSTAEEQYSQELEQEMHEQDIDDQTIEVSTNVHGACVVNTARCETIYVLLVDPLKQFHAVCTPYLVV